MICILFIINKNFIKYLDIFRIIDKREKLYPKIHRIWQGTVPEVRISIAEFAETIISSSKHIEKSYGYNFLTSWLGSGLLTAKGKKTIFFLIKSYQNVNG